MINAYMVDPITILKWNGYDDDNMPHDRTTITGLRGYVEWKTHLVRDLKGEEVTSGIKVYLHLRKTDLALGRALCHEDIIVVDGFERSIVAIHEPKAFSKPHYEIYLSSAGKQWA